MVTSMYRYQITNMYIFYESLRDAIHIITKRRGQKDAHIKGIIKATSQWKTNQYC
jgi:hypothetical protein